MTKHNRRRRHALVDFMAAGSGGFFVDFITRHNWSSAVGMILLGAATYALDSDNIEDEEGQSE